MMINKDKFGNTIYAYIFIKLKKYGKILTIKGYQESRKNQNLFYKSITKGRFYADMRGTDEVKIWEDSKPLFYWFFATNLELWKRRRLIKAELIDLYKLGCPCRLYSNFHDCEEFENTGGYIDEDKGIYGWNDGHCIKCGLDFQNEGAYCSLECEQKYIEEHFWIRCVLCGIKKPAEQIVFHHICYEPEETIIVCRSCHLKIHRTDFFPHLKPK